MVILLNVQIKNGKIEFEKGNYQEALNHFEQAVVDDKDYEYVQFLKVVCLMELEQYRDALGLANSLISQDPYNKSAWFNKALCYIFMDEDEKALGIMDDILRIIDADSKYDLILVSKLYKLLKDYDEALKYCGDALKLDDEFGEAWYEKFFLGIHIGDSEMVSQASQKLYVLCDGNMLGFMPLFLVKIFSRDYSGCMELIETWDIRKSDERLVEILKSIIFKEICENLNINLLLVDEGEVSIDDALDVMLDFVENGTNNGKIDEIQYFIM